MRKAEPSHGPERISFYLPKLFKVQCPPSTVFNVLKRFGLVDKGERKKRSKKHLKRYRRPIPGYLQMDIKYVPYRINGEQYYEFNAVDHCSSWRLIRAYEDKSYFSLLKFLSDRELWDIRDRFVGSFCIPLCIWMGTEFAGPVEGVVRPR